MYNILRAQTAIHLKETKNETKIFLWKYTEKYRHLFSQCFKNGVLGCQEMVFVNVFSGTKQKHVCWKIYKVKKVIFNVIDVEVEIHKVNEVF